MTNQKLDDKGSFAAQLNHFISNAGHDESSEIQQFNGAITPGVKDFLGQLFGTAYIPGDLISSYNFILTGGFSDHQLTMKEIDTSQMNFAMQSLTASMLLSNSVNGRNQEVRKGLVGTIAGSIGGAAKRWYRKGRGYESGFGED